MPLRRTLLVYAVVGPPIGWLVYAAGLIAMDSRTWSSLARLGHELQFLLSVLPLSYVVGLVPALVVGILVALIAGPERSGFPVVTTIGIVCGVLFAFVFGGGDSVFADPEAPFLFVLKVLTCLVPSLICWWLARPKRADASEAGNEAVQK